MFVSTKTIVEWLAPGDDLGYGIVLSIDELGKDRIIVTLANDDCISQQVYATGQIVDVLNYDEPDWNECPQETPAPSDFDEDGYYVGPFEICWGLTREGQEAWSAGSKALDKAPLLWKYVYMMKNTRGEYDDRPFDMMSAEDLTRYIEQYEERRNVLADKGFGGQWQTRKIDEMLTDLRKELSTRR